jgi:polyisoprenoid-binding protein YceI
VTFRRSFLLASLALAIGATAAAADPVAFTIDPNHSAGGFNVRHFFSRVSGRFRTFSGTVQYDEKNLAASSVDVTIQAASITTENDERDRDLRSSDFFAVDSFPTLTFKSTKVVPGANGAFQIQGDLTIHGVKRPVALDATLLGVGDVSMGGRGVRRVAGFEAKTTINRKDFGIIWNRTLDQGGTMLGDDVAITLQVEANAMKTAAAAPAAAPDKPPATSAEKK